MKGCLTVSQNGRIEPLYGKECEEPLPAICKYQACYTVEGENCMFPFTHKGITYKNCSTQDLHRPWCATGWWTLNVGSECEQDFKRDVREKV